MKTKCRNPFKQVNYFNGIFSALFLAFSLFLIILIALPVGVKYFKMYLELLLFLAIWPALMAVYNYVMDLIVQNGYTYLANQGYSIDSAHTVNMYVSHQLGIMGYLSWSVPMMAYALVSGSTYAMTGVVGSIDFAAKSGATKGAEVAGTGNLSMGNDSMGNYNANKVNSAAQDVAGVMPRQYWQTGPNGSTETLYDANGNAYAKNIFDGTMTGSERINNGNASAGDFQFKNTGADLGYSGENLTTATDPNILATIGSDITSTSGRNWSNNIANSMALMNKLGSSLSGNLKQDFSNDRTNAAMSAIEQTHGIKSSVKSELTHYIEGGASFGMQDGVFGVEGKAGFKAIRGITKSQELSLMQKYSTNLSDKLSHSKALSTVMSSTQGRELTKSLNDTVSSGQSYSFARSNKGMVAQNYLRAYLNKMNEPLRKSGASEEQLAKYDNGIIKNLEQNPAPLENFVKENPNLQLDKKAIYGLNSSGKAKRGNIAAMYKSLAPGTSFASVSKDISLVAQKRYHYSTNGSKEVKYADNIATAKKLYKEGRLSKAMEQKYIDVQTGKLNKARGIEKTIPTINKKINTAGNLVKVGPSVNNPINPNTKLTAPKGVAWKTSMTIKHPNDANFKSHSNPISTVKPEHPIKPPDTTR